jgi:ferredoxin
MARTVALRAARQPVTPSTHPHLRIDPSICDGVGICSHLAPDLITVDSWGYPILSTAALERANARRQAEAAVAACPKKALYLDS